MHPTVARSIVPRALRRGALPWFLPGALLLYFLRFGYDYGTSDQDEVVPYLLHRLHPAWFTEDWFVMVQASGFSIRGYFVTVLQSLALFLPVWLSVLLVYLACWLALAAAVFALGHAFTGDRPAACAAVVAALVLTPQWTLGGNDLVHAMLVPSMAAWCLGLWGLVLFLRARMPWAGVLLGLATWMQALVGMHLAGLLGLVLLFRLAKDGRRALQPLLVFSAAYLVSALPALGPLLFMQLGGPSPGEAAGRPPLFYIMAAFRNPHHYLPGAFPLRAVVRFGLLVVLGGIGYVFLYRKRRVRHGALPAQLFFFIACFCLLAFVFTEIIPSLFIASLQFFKMTVLAKVLLVILLCGTASALLPERASLVLHRLMDHRGWIFVVAGAWFLVLAGLFLDVGFLRGKVGPLARRGTPVAAVEAWARAHTPPDAVFAVPPSWSGFRSHARRAIVIDYKAFPFRKDAVYAWFERLTATAPISLPSRAGPALQDSLDAAFLRLAAPALLALARRYNASYVVRAAPLVPVHPAFEQVFSSGPWIVYRHVKRPTA